MVVAEWKRSKEEHSHALHGDEWGEECMRHDMKRKEKHRDSMVVICSFDKIERKETTKSIKTMLGVLSCNMNSWCCWSHTATSSSSNAKPLSLCFTCTLESFIFLFMGHRLTKAAWMLSMLAFSMRGRSSNHSSARLPRSSCSSKCAILLMSNHDSGRLSKNCLNHLAGGSTSLPLPWKSGRGLGQSLGMTGGGGGALL